MKGCIKMEPEQLYEILTMRSKKVFLSVSRWLYVNHLFQDEIKPATELWNWVHGLN